MDDALAVASRWWHARGCRQVATEGDSVAIFLNWMAEHRAGRKRLLDTLLAASYRAAKHGVPRVVVVDVATYERLTAPRRSLVDALLAAPRFEADELGFERDPSPSRPSNLS